MPRSRSFEQDGLAEVQRSFEQDGLAEAQQSFEQDGLAVQQPLEQNGLTIHPSPSSGGPVTSSSTRTLAEIDTELSNVFQKLKLLRNERNAWRDPLTSQKNSLTDIIKVDFITTNFYYQAVLDTEGLKDLIFPSLETFECRYIWGSTPKPSEFVDLTTFLFRHHYYNKLNFSLIIDPSSLSHCSKAGPLSIFSAMRQFARYVTKLTMNLSSHSKSGLSHQDKEGLRDFLCRLDRICPHPELLEFPNLETLVISFRSIDNDDIGSEYDSKLLNVILRFNPKAFVINIKQVPNEERLVSFEAAVLQALRNTGMKVSLEY